jgi:hypothetical protein
MGPATRHRHGRLALRLAVLGGVAVSVVALSTPALAAVAPKITATKATFAIPAGSTSTFTLKLWSQGSFEGSSHGTSGTLTVPVPFTNSCLFQADVTVVPVGATQSYFYSGSRASVHGCGPAQTIAGDIFLCDANGATTTTHSPNGSLEATGPQTVSSPTSQLASMPALAGTYSMTAVAPTGYVFVACGGTPPVTIDTSGTAASENVVVPAGGPGSGTFYVVLAAPTGSLGGGGTPGGGATGPAVGPPTSPGSSGGKVTLTQNKAAAPTKVNSAHLAFTGMNTGPLLLSGLLLLALGVLATAGARIRRRTAVVVDSDSGSRPHRP